MCFNWSLKSFLRPLEDYNQARDGLEYMGECALVIHTNAVLCGRDEHGEFQYVGKGGVGRCSGMRMFPVYRGKPRSLDTCTE